MKKFITIGIVFVILIFGLQLCVQADMGAPMIKHYKAKVINPNGVKCIDELGNVTAELEYGDEIEIEYEFSNGNEKYGSFETGNEPYMFAQVNLKDIAPVEEMYVSDELQLDNPIDRVVVAEEGAILYKGPGYGYETTEKVIPRGTEIVVYYEEEYSDNPWFYTTYEGISGWVCELNTLGTYTDEEKVILYEIELTEFVTGDEVPEKLGTIPACTVIKNVILLDPWRQSYYVEYDGKWGMISIRDIAWDMDEIRIYKSEKEVNIYQEYVYGFMFENPNIDTSNLTVIGTIPANTEIAVKYTDYIADGFFISYNGVQGWIPELDFENVKTVQTTDLELPSFDDFTIIETPKIPVEGKEDEILISEDENVVAGENTNKDEVITIQVTPEQIVTLGVASAVVIALTCIVTIILVNKTSKKDKKEEK